MRLPLLRSPIAAFLLVACFFSWATPSFALRQVGLEESNQLPHLKKALSAAGMEENGGDELGKLAQEVPPPQKAEFLPEYFQRLVARYLALARHNDDGKVVVTVLGQDPTHGSWKRSEVFEPSLQEDQAASRAERFAQQVGEFLLPERTAAEQFSSFTVRLDGSKRIVELHAKNPDKGFQAGLEETVDASWNRYDRVLSQTSVSLGQVRGKSGQQSLFVGNALPVSRGLNEDILAPMRRQLAQSLVRSGYRTEEEAFEALMERARLRSRVLSSTEQNLLHVAIRQALAAGLEEPWSDWWRKLRRFDPKAFDLILAEVTRINRDLNTIASETGVRQEILVGLASPLVLKYAEGYPPPEVRYYQGAEVVNQVEIEAQTRWLEQAGTVYKGKAKSISEEYALPNVQPHSGSNANLAAHFAALMPGDVTLGMELTHGGHLTHGFRLNFSGRYYRNIQFGVGADGAIDYDALEQRILQLPVEQRPRLLIVGGTAYTKRINWERLRQFVDRVNANNAEQGKPATMILVADVAHNFAQILAKHYPSPFGYADIITLTTHKSGGPRAGIIFARNRVYPEINQHLGLDPVRNRKRWESTTLAEWVNRAIIPGTQGGASFNEIIAKAIQARWFQIPDFKRYAGRIGPHAKELAQALTAQDSRVLLVGNGTQTETHLLLWDVRPFGLNGVQAAWALESVGIITNANTIPGDSAMNPSGIRVGVPAMMWRGMRWPEMKEVAQLMVEALRGWDAEHGRIREEVRAAVEAKVRALTARFPLYPEFEEMLRAIQQEPLPVHFDLVEGLGDLGKTQLPVFDREGPITFWPVPTTGTGVSVRWYDVERLAKLEYPMALWIAVPNDDPFFGADHTMNRYVRVFLPVTGIDEHGVDPARLQVELHEKGQEPKSIRGVPRRTRINEAAGVVIEIEDDGLVIRTDPNVSKPVYIGIGRLFSGLEEKEKVRKATAAVAAATIGFTQAQRTADPELIRAAEAVLRSAQASLERLTPPTAGSSADSFTGEQSGLEEGRLADAVLLSFDPAAGLPLLRAGIRAFVVVPTLTDARHQIKLGVEPEQLVGVLWAGLEERDYLSVNSRIRNFVTADLAVSGWQQEVVRFASSQLGAQHIVPIYGADSLATGLEELGVPGAKVARILQLRSDAEAALEQMK